MRQPQERPVLLCDTQSSRQLPLLAVLVAELVLLLVVSRHGGQSDMRAPLLLLVFKYRSAGFAADLASMCHQTPPHPGGGLQSFCHSAHGMGAEERVFSNLGGLP